jgi:hypothetical protein
MYNDESEPAKNAPLEQSGLRTRKIRVGIVEYEVPTQEWVRHLEQLVQHQADLIEQQRRALDRLDTLLRGTRSFVRRQTDTLFDPRNRKT